MTILELLAQTQRLAIGLHVEGTQLRVRAPKGVLTRELQEAIATHKAALLQRLQAPRAKEPPPADEIGAACPDCGSTEKWRWIDGSLICRRGLIQGDHLGRRSEQERKKTEDASARESGEDHGHDAVVGAADRDTQGTAAVRYDGGLDAEVLKVSSVCTIHFHSVYDLTMVTDFLSACRVWERSEDISRRHDRHTHAYVYSFRASAAVALVGYLLTSATCFTAAERRHRAGTIRWQLTHGVAGGVYTPHQDPKAPRVLATQMPLFGTTHA
jgi:hypothetical protein